MPTQELNGDLWTLYRHKNDEWVEYWAAVQAGPNGRPDMKIRATQNALHPEWDEVPLKYTVDGGVMDYERFMELYERVEA